MIATYLGLPLGQDRLPDLSPAGRVAMDALSRSTLTELDAAESAAGREGRLAGHERRCGRLLRERLEADLATSADEEYLREVVNVYGLQQRVQEIFLLMPTSGADDWAAVARRMGRIPAALAGHREALADAARRGLFKAAPRQVKAMITQFDAWLADADGRGWFAGFCAAADVPQSLRTELDDAAAAAAAAVADLRQWFGHEYLALAEGTADGVGADRYGVWVRFWNGASLDLAETYDWGWRQYRDLQAQMRAAAEQVLPGGTVRAAMQHLDRYGEAVEGVEQILARLQQLLDEVISDLNGTHFDLPDPVRSIEVKIAPPGGAVAPYYTPPPPDFSRPGRIWVPTMGRTRFPVWGLLSTVYHEGVPGHHLQLAQWAYLSGQLSVYQTSLGGVDACIEGWALYAERLLDELGYLQAADVRMGYLDWQLMRAIRVIIDIGMHLELAIPADSPVGGGQRWTPGLAAEFFGLHTARPDEFVAGEIDRYLGLPGQAISYKVGERAWLAGREAARSAHAARGESFDLKAWHMAALSLGSLGLDDLTDELSRL